MTWHICYKDNATTNCKKFCEPIWKKVLKCIWKWWEGFKLPNQAVKSLFYDNLCQETFSKEAFTNLFLERKAFSGLFLFFILFNSWWWDSNLVHRSELIALPAVPQPLPQQITLIDFACKCAVCLQLGCHWVFCRRSQIYTHLPIHQGLSGLRNHPEIDLESLKCLSWTRVYGKRERLAGLVLKRNPKWSYLPLITWPLSDLMPLPLI